MAKKNQKKVKETELNSVPNVEPKIFAIFEKIHGTEGAKKLLNK